MKFGFNTIFFLVFIINCKAQNKLITKKEIDENSTSIKHLTYYFNTNDSIEELNFVEYKVFDQNKNIIMEYNLNSKLLYTGQYKEFYTNGNLKQILNYYEGFPIGLYLSFYENGNLKEYGNYRFFENYDEKLIKRDTVITENLEFGEIEISYKKNYSNFKNGFWYYYDINGNIIRKELFDN